MIGEFKGSDILRSNLKSRNFQSYEYEQHFNRHFGIRIKGKYLDNFGVSLPLLCLYLEEDRKEGRLSDCDPKLIPESTDGRFTNRCGSLMLLLRPRK